MGRTDSTVWWYFKFIERPNRMPTQKYYEAVVSSLQGENSNRYAVCYLSDSQVELPNVKKGETITFSLNCWKDASSLPEKGEVVRLRDIRKFKKGWRALHASPFQAHSNQ